MAKYVPPHARGGNFTSSWNLPAQRPVTCANQSWCQPVAQAPSRPTSPQHALLASGDSKVGLVCWYSSANLTQSSVVYNQHWVNQVASSHPMVIVGLSSDKKMATVMPITSFSAYTSLQDKYKNASDPVPIFDQYMAIQHGQCTIPHNSSPVLALDGGMNMAKQSYVHVEQFFQIETCSLSAFESKTTRVLTAGAIQQVQSKLRTVISLGGSRLQQMQSPFSSGKLWSARELFVQSTTSSPQGVAWHCLKRSHAIPVVRPSNAAISVAS